MVIGVIIGEKDGKHVVVGEPGPLDKVKNAFRSALKSGCGGCSRLTLLSTRGTEKRARFNPQRRKSEPQEPEVPTDEEALEGGEPTETLGEVVDGARKRGRKPKES